MSMSMSICQASPCMLYTCCKSSESNPHHAPVRDVRETVGQTRAYMYSAQVNLDIIYPRHPVQRDGGPILGNVEGLGHWLMEPEPERVPTDAAGAGSRPAGQQNSPVRERSPPRRSGALGGNAAAVLASGRLHASGSTADGYADLLGSSPTVGASALPPPPPVGAAIDSAESIANRKADLRARRQR
eukprot:COSAG02_NODE_29072_length_576_cov_1.352201_1_plen_185_part_10